LLWAIPWLNLLSKKAVLRPYTHPNTALNVRKTSTTIVVRHSSHITPTDLTIYQRRLQAQ
jgi:hypothetical protein